MRAGMISFAGNATLKFPYDIIIKTCDISTNATVGSRQLLVANNIVTGASAAASQNQMDLLGGITPSVGVSGHGEVAVPANTAITIGNGVAGDTIVMSYLALP